ncbi:zinc finger Y-chromosomal protein 1-like [Coccinella septempunctata]|uniref:zinc finger Y-chromosomal protein 1-like n=1 Tax=Coccinella septempunctata TaxID=41139 RepID=UPI001D076F36|nr:zinc finger Y-chromosomal protein 1-like [Coccinella septempunctata]
MEGNSCINIEEDVHITCDEVKLEKKLGIMDIFEEFIDEKGVHDREKYIIKNEESNPNFLIEKVDASKSTASCVRETAQTLDPLCNKLERPYHWEQSEFPKYQNDYPPGEEKYRDEHIEYDHTASPKDDKQWSVESLPLNVKNYKCPMCDFETNYEEKLSFHIKSVHLSIKCDLCEFVTTEKHNLQRHVLRVHLDLKKHKCHFCEYVTDRKGSLQKHVDSVHLNIKNHKCNFVNMLQVLSKNSICT